MPMTAETPAHGERFGAIGEGHGGNWPVAGRAADPFRDMDAVVEIDIIRNAIDTRPVQRLMLRETVANRLQDSRIGPDLGMTGHADTRGRQTGKRGALDACMAITAVEPQAADMVFVAERHRLSRDNVLLCGVRGLPICVGQTNRRDWDKDDGRNDNARDTVRPRAKKLSHPAIA